MKVQPRPLIGVLCLLAYLAAFFAVWIVNDVDYEHHRRQRRHHAEVVRAAPARRAASCWSS